MDATQQPSYAGSFYDPPANAYSGGIFTPSSADNFESGGIGSEFDDEPPLLEGNYFWVDVTNRLEC